jgi:hypothetical protein
MPTVFNAKKVTITAGASNILAAIEDFVENDSLYWEVEDTDTNSFIAANIDNGDRLGFQLSGSNIIIYMEPDLMNSWDVADLAGTKSASASGGSAFNDSNAGTDVFFSEAVDMLQCLVRHTSSDLLVRGFQAGRIISGFHTGLPLTGRAIFAGTPGVASGTTAGVWLSTNTSITSEIEFNNGWHRPRAVSMAGQAGLVDGIEVLPPSMGMSISTSRTLAFCRYILEASTTADNRVVLPSKNSDQAWLYVRYSGSLTNSSVMPWNKTVIA